MASAFLINTVRGTFGILYAGTEVDDVSALAAAVLSAGGQLIAATNSTVAAAALRAQANRARGGDPDEAAQIMNSALDAAQEGAELASFANGIDVATTLTHAGTLGLHGAAAVAQPADPVVLSDSSGGAAPDNTVQALTDPVDAPGTADILRDDLVANLIPELRNNLRELTEKYNALHAVLSAGAGGNGITA